MIGRWRRGVVVKSTTKVQFRGVEGGDHGSLVRERGTVGTEDGGIDGGRRRRRGEGANEFAKEVGKTENSDEEDKKRFSGGGWRSTRGGCWGKTTENGKGGRGERCCVGGWGSAGDFGEEGAQPAEEGEDAENGAKGGAEVGELFGYRNHCYERRLVPRSRVN